MRARVLYFGPCRQQAGCDAETVDLPGSRATVKDLMDRCCVLHPGLAPARAALLVAVNQEFAKGDAVITGVEEIAVMPPVSGGKESEANGTLEFLWTSVKIGIVAVLVTIAVRLMIIAHARRGPGESWSNQTLDQAFMDSPSEAMGLLLDRAAKGDADAFAILQRHVQHDPATWVRLGILEGLWTRGIMSDAEWVPMAVDALNVETQSDRKRRILSALGAVRGTPFCGEEHFPQSDAEWRQVSEAVRAWYGQNKDALSKTPLKHELNPPGKS